MKKISKALILMLVVIMAFSAAACSAKKEPEADPNATVEFTDSTGRTVTVPQNIEKVAVSGPLSQIVLFALCPDKLVGVANEWDSTATEYIDSKYLELPLLGQLYGGKGELNLETLLSSGAQVVIDIGEPKDTIAEDMNALSEQTGIAFIHIDATTETMGNAYRLLGELLNMKDEAEVLASYCDETYANAKAIADGATKANILYITGDKGLNVIAKGSYHAEIIDLLANNLAAVDSPSSKGTGNEVDMEQILTWNPDIIIFSPDSIYDTVATDEVWANVSAVQSGNYYETPYGPYNWMGFPPSVQRYLGMLWMNKLLYPQNADYDLYTEVKEYFSLFYHCELSEESYNKLVENSIGK